MGRKAMGFYGFPLIMRPTVTIFVATTFPIPAASLLIVEDSVNEGHSPKYIMTNLQKKSKQNNYGIALR
jgi:hypothetical protein